LAKSNYYGTTKGKSLGQSGRYELKYIVEEERAVAIADYTRSFLRPSAHNGVGSVRGHAVCSLYMDSPDFFFFRQANTGHKNRFKLRIRFYDDDWSRPAFFEIKHRIAEVICKDRAMISREGVRQFLTQGWPDPRSWPDPALLAQGKKRFNIYYKFWDLATRTKAQGIAFISYLREIYEAPDDELRVTFDRQISATRYDGSGKLILPKWGYRPPPDRPPYYLPLNGVIVELKYDDRAPMWMYDMVRIFNMQRLAMCKYCACVDGMGLPWGNIPCPSNEVPLLLHESL
jgi:hypothetical protein